MRPTCSRTRQIPLKTTPPATHGPQKFRAQYRFPRSDVFRNLIGLSKTPPFSSSLPPSSLVQDLPSLPGYLVGPHPVLRHSPAPHGSRGSSQLFLVPAALRWGPRLGIPGWQGPRIRWDKRTPPAPRKSEEPTPNAERVQMYCTWGYTEWSTWPSPSPFFRSPSWRRPLNGGRWRPPGRKCCAMRPSSLMCCSGTWGEWQCGGRSVWNVPRGEWGFQSQGLAFWLVGKAYGAQSRAPFEREEEGQYSGFNLIGMWWS